MARRLLIGLDPSPGGRDALALGRELAAALDARPRAVAVVDFPHAAVHDLDPLADDETRALLGEARAVLADLDPETHVAISESPAGALYDDATRHDALAIVVGSTRRGMLGRVFPGATGDRLLNGAPCAVAVAPRGYAERGGNAIRRIAVAYDGSEESEAALAAAVDLAPRLGASLALVDVARTSFAGWGGATWPYSIGELRQLELDECRRILDRGMRRVPAGTDAGSELLEGPPAETLAEASADFDLLLIGSRGYGPVRRTLVGGVSSRVIREARCPVLVLPRGEGAGIAREAPMAMVREAGR